MDRLHFDIKILLLGAAADQSPHTLLALSRASKAFHAGYKSLERTLLLRCLSALVKPEPRACVTADITIAIMFFDNDHTWDGFTRAVDQFRSYSSLAEVPIRTIKGAIRVHINVLWVCYAAMWLCEDMRGECRVFNGLGGKGMVKAIDDATDDWAFTISGWLYSVYDLLYKPVLDDLLNKPAQDDFEENHTESKRHTSQNDEFMDYIAENMLFRWRERALWSGDQGCKPRTDFLISALRRSTNHFFSCLQSISGPATDNEIKKTWRRVTAGQGIDNKLDVEEAEDYFKDNNGVLVKYALQSLVFKDCNEFGGTMEARYMGRYLTGIFWASDGWWSSRPLSLGQFVGEKRWRSEMARKSGYPFPEKEGLLAEYLKKRLKGRSAEYKDKRLARWIVKSRKRAMTAMAEYWEEDMDDGWVCGFMLYD